MFLVGIKWYGAREKTTKIDQNFYQIYTMRKLKYLQLLIVIVACQSSYTSAQTKPTGTVRGIDAYCKTIDAITENSNEPQMVFGDTSDSEDSNAKPNWQKFESSNALEKFREKSETYSIAYNWLKGGKIVASNFTNFSPSGDWTMYVYHYFREDGTLARVRSELRTFEGDYIVIQTRYFSRSGRQLSKTVKYLDLMTHKPKKATSMFNSSFSSSDYFKTTKKLPFAQLMEK